ncbi:hypothetical protein V6N12_056224 [Hibiscus sabdariffa]|uniref:Uncharacterized protein n=1 Tax=Hibiscus sabdariffa TaxID=183260 RepID=A0ABR2CRW0_9ROSI
MALPLCCNARLRPCCRSSSHYERRFHFVNRRTLRFSRSGDISICSKRISHRLPPLKSSSSVNGFPVETNLDNFKEGHTVESLELRERIRKWIDFLRSVLPGGSWWSFSDEVDVKFTAKPVTVWRALARMWQLIANDRLVIFAGFSTLIVAAVIAVLVGGMYILAGLITAEKLTKFILYSEWLIYSTWWVGDNVSSLMQSVGASEKVFQLMDLMPSDQFTSKGGTPKTMAFAESIWLRVKRLRPVSHSFDSDMASWAHASCE